MYYTLLATAYCCLWLSTSCLGQLKKVSGYIFFKFFGKIQNTVKT